MSTPKRSAGRSGRPITRFRDAITRWYAVQRRDLPWRRRPTPYRVWVSEIMLQQTRVDVVVPYFQRFLARFPSVRALAGAPEESVMEAWSGLGYYRRGRMLQEGARFLLERHRGRFPRTLDDALEIPGVGRYTAGAVLSIAYGIRVPLVDGNVARVLSRVFGIEGDLERNPGRTTLWNIAQKMVEEGEPSTVNQAMMELGALVCTPRAPRCEECPIESGCFARRHGLVDRLPQLGAKRAVVDVSCPVLLVRDGAHVLLRRRAAGELMPGLWDLPGSFAGDDGDRGASLEQTLVSLFPGVEVGARLGVVRHQVTYRRIALEVHEARVAAGSRSRVTTPASSALRWALPEEAESMALAAPARKILARWGAPAGTAPSAAALPLTLSKRPR